MAGYTVIADAGLSLLKLLQKDLIPEPIEDKEKIGLCSPLEKQDFQLTLYLYDVEENREFSITEMTKLPDGNLGYPPTPYMLYFLITAHSTADIKSKALDEHKILGRVIQVLNDNSLLEKENLVGSLKDEEQEIRIQKRNLTYDEIIKIWNFNTVPYSLSVVYSLGPILIDSTRIKKVKRVVESTIHLVNKDGG